MTVVVAVQVVVVLTRRRFNLYPQIAVQNQNNKTRQMDGWKHSQWLDLLLGEHAIPSMASVAVSPTVGAVAIKTSTWDYAAF